MPQQAAIERWLIQTLPLLLQALVVVVATMVLVRLTRGWLAQAMDRARVDRGTRILVTQIVAVGISVLGLVTVLSVLGAEPATLAAILGTTGIAFGLALQDILKNFFSGIYLLLERPFRVGDAIRVKDQEGIVEHVGVRTTLLRTAENVQVLVPNAIVFAEVVSNTTNRVPKQDEKLATVDSAQPRPLAATSNEAPTSRA